MTPTCDQLPNYMQMLCRGAAASPARGRSTTPQAPLRRCVWGCGQHTCNPVPAAPSVCDLWDSHLLCGEGRYGLMVQGLTGEARAPLNLALILPLESPVSSSHRAVGDSINRSGQLLRTELGVVHLWSLSLSQLRHHSSEQGPWEETSVPTPSSRQAGTPFSCFFSEPWGLSAGWTGCPAPVVNARWAAS